MATSRSVGVHEAKTHFSHLLREVDEGAEIVVTRGGEPVAKIVPVAKRSRASESRGMFAGRLRLSDDFGQDGDEFGDLFGIPRPA